MGNKKCTCISHRPKINRAAYNDRCRSGRFGVWCLGEEAGIGLLEGFVDEIRDIFRGFARQQGGKQFFLDVGWYDLAGKRPTHSISYDENPESRMF